MKHLSPSEFVEYVEGTLDRERAGHVGACAGCWNEAAALRDGLHQASIVDVPEPSPLFWDHFSARVREEIARSPVRTHWVWAHLRPLTAVAAAMLFLVVVFVWRPSPRKGGERGQPTADVSNAQGKALYATELAAPSSPLQTSDADDEAWTLLKDAAGDLQIDEARALGFEVHPGAVDRAVLELSPRERAELGRLIEDEIRQTPRPARRGVKELS